MRWSAEEQKQLWPILEQVVAALGPLEGKHVLVLGSAAGQVARMLAQRVGEGQVVGTDLALKPLEAARRRVQEWELEGRLEFQQAETDRLLFPEASFDALVSECIVFPTSLPSQLGLSELARVLKPGGKLVLTDVITPEPPSPQVRAELERIGLDYLCDATQKDFLGWMEEAGMRGVEVRDFTGLVRKIWERRRSQDADPAHRRAYRLLLDDPQNSIGRDIFYIFVQGTKPSLPMRKGLEAHRAVST